MSPRAQEIGFQFVFAFLHGAALLHALAVAYHVRKLRRAMFAGVQA